jgi:PAS domain-containing protein
MAGGISCLCADGRLEKLLAFGGPEQSLDEYWRPPLDAGMPHREALRTLQPIWLESPQQIEARYPHLAGLRARLGVQAWAVVPFVVRERAVGALGLRFSEAHRFEPDEREFLLSLANACAQALERARLFEEKERLYQQSEALLARERVARHEAEAASRALQVERAHLQSVIDQLPASVVIADRTGKIVAGNSALERDIRSPIVYPLSLEDHARPGPETPLVDRFVRSLGIRPPGAGRTAVERSGRDARRR